MATSIPGQLGHLFALDGRKLLTSSEDAGKQKATDRAEKELGKLNAVLARRQENGGEFFPQTDVFQSKGIVKTIEARTPDQKNWPEMKPAHEDIPDNDHFERAGTHINDQLTSDFIRRQREDIKQGKAIYGRDKRFNESQKRVCRDMAQEYLETQRKIQQSSWSKTEKEAAIKESFERFRARANAYVRENPERRLESFEGIEPNAWEMESRDWSRAGGRKVAPIMVDKKGVCHIPADEY